jgi:PAS domain S-box-containing protein
LNEEQLIHAKQAARGIEDFFTTWTGVLSSLAKMQEIADLDSDGKRYASFFYEAHKDQIRSITRMDEKGDILFTIPFNQSVGRNIANQKHVQEILKEHKPVVSDVFRAVQGFDGVALHVPVFRGTTFKGTIAVVVDFQSLAKRYLEAIRIGETGYAWVVSRDGTILYTPEPGSTGKSVFEVFKEYPSVLDMARDMLAGRQGVATYISDRIDAHRVDSVRKRAVYYPIQLENTFWSIVVASSEKEVLFSLAAFRNRLLLVFGVITVSGLLLSMLAARAWLVLKEEEERKQAAEILRASEQRYRDLFNQNPAPVLIYERGTFRMLAVNEAFLRHYGYTEEEALALNLPDLYPESEKGPIMELATRLRGQAYVGEWHHRKKDGTVFPMVARSHDIEYDDRSARIAVVSDITDRKRAEEELRSLNETLDQKVRARTAELERANERLQELDRLKSMFIASMSHELRTPLNSIIGFTGVMLKGLAGPLNEEQRDQLERVFRSGKHLLALITDVIDIAKIESGKIVPYPESFVLADVIRDACDSVSKDIADKGLALEVELPAEPVTLHTDRRRLLQCVLNLLSNAVKFTEAGSIKLSGAASGDGFADLAVADTGIGIRPEDQERLFGSFVRLDSPLKITVPGTGLGLYLTRKLAREVLGGDVTVQSAPGIGSRFTLRVPLELPLREESNN